MTWVVIHMAHSRQEAARLTQMLSREGVLVRLKPGCWITERMIPHAGYDESCFLLQGELELHLGTRVYTIRSGDSFYVPQDMLHNYLNISEEEAVCMVYFSKLIY